MTNQAIAPTSDEGLMAAIAHFFGLLVALIVWITQKDKSRYVRFQSVQAMAFDIIVSVLMLLVVGLIMILVFGVLALGVGNIAIIGSQGNPSAEPIRTIVALMAAAPFLIPCLVIPVVGVVFVVRLVATIQTFQGKNFHYPWLGNIIEKSMGY